MTSIKEHLETAKILEEELEEKLRKNDVVRAQKIVGFAASEAATNLFAALLHKKKLISEGFNVNHLFFSSQKQAELRFDLDLPEKTTLLTLLVKQEGFREKLCYGRQKDEKIVLSAIENFYKIKELLEKNMGVSSG